MKSVLCTALGLVLATGLSWSQEPAAAKAPGDKKCDVSKSETRAWCKACATFPIEAEIEKGACKKCKEKVEQVPTCVKKVFRCHMHGDGEILHSKRCCKPEVKDCCNEESSLARVQYACDACGQRGATEKDVKHLKETCDGKIAKTCEKSGTFPHGGEEAKGGTPPK